jgi:FtsZ-interacting cell division protein ZipA
MAIRTVTRAGVGLVVGIIILGLLVLGGLYLVRERGEQARREEAINIADQQLQAESNKDIAINTDDNSNETPAKEDAAPAATGQADTKDESPVTTTPPAAATELPQTGPGAISVVGIGLLSFAVASFVHSRKLV